jgi:hypothetical protein
VGLLGSLSQTVQDVPRIKQLQMETLTSLDVAYQTLLEQLDDVKRQNITLQEQQVVLQKTLTDILSTLVKPFTQTTPNATSALDERLYKQEQEIWDEVIVNPFDGMVID